MMLRALYELSRSRGLVEDPLYEKRPVDFLIRLDGSGRLLSLEPTRDERGRGMEALVPRAPKRSVNIAPGFLVDNVKYVLGWDKLDKQDEARMAQCTAAFRQMVARCAQETQDAGAAAVLGFLDQKEQYLPDILLQRPREEWTGSEMMVFALSGDESPRVHERPAIRDWWARQNAEEAPGAGGGLRCLVTGRPAVPARLHPSIKRLPQAQTSGASLVSFNADSFLSQGLEQGENAPVSREAAVGYATALNWLLEGTPERRFRYGVPVGEDAVTVFWTGDDRNPLSDDLLLLMDPPRTADEAVRAAESPWRGLEPAEVDETRFYAVTLSGNAARVVIRGWLETTAKEVKTHLRRYFEDLRLGNGPDRPMPLRQLVEAVAAPGGRGLAPDMASRLFGAALRGQPFPRELLGAALRRLRLPPDPVGEGRLLRLRCALIKATLLRLPRSADTRLEITVSLDENNTRTPYLLGRLFAVLERLQGAALGDVNATIRDRYFGAASATPALVFSRLLRLSVHHAAKAEGSGWLEKLKGRIISALPPDHFPRVLSLEDQGLFAIGYYHQREEFFRKRENAAPAEEASE